MRLATVTFIFSTYLPQDNKKVTKYEINQRIGGGAADPSSCPPFFINLERESDCSPFNN